MIAAETKQRDASDKTAAINGGNHQDADVKLEAPAETAAASTEAPTRSPLTHFFGDIVWLLAQSPAHRHLFLADLEWSILPPLLHKQFRIFYAKSQPIAVGLWASVSEEVEKELIAGRTRLKPAEWKSGDRIWLMALVAPGLSGNQKAMEGLFKQFSESAFSGKTFKVLGQQSSPPKK